MPSIEKEKEELNPDKPPDLKRVTKSAWVRISLEENSHIEEAVLRQWLQIGQWPYCEPKPSSTLIPEAKYL